MPSGNDKALLRQWVREALVSLGGSGSIIEICQHVWMNHEEDLRDAGDLFYTWQYDMRWAATDLRGQGVMRSAAESPKGIWELASSRR